MSDRSAAVRESSAVGACWLQRSNFWLFKLKKEIVVSWLHLCVDVKVQSRNWFSRSDRDWDYPQCTSVIFCIFIVELLVYIRAIFVTCCIISVHVVQCDCGGATVSTQGCKCHFVLFEHVRPVTAALQWTTASCARTELKDYLAPSSGRSVILHPGGRRYS